MKHIERASSSRRAEYEQVALSLAMQYDIIHYVNMDDECYSVFSSTDEYPSLELPADGDRYFERMKSQLKALTHPEDWGSLCGMFDLLYLSNAISHGESLDRTFRFRCRDEYIYMSMHIIRAADRRHIVFGFRNVDAIVRQNDEEERRAWIFSDIARTLARKYTQIYHLDPETGICICFATEAGGADAVSEMSIDAFFQIIRRFSIHKDDRNAMKPLESIDSLTDHLENEKHLVFTVRLKHNHRFVYTRFRCMWADDMQHIIIAVYDVDEKVRSIQAQERNLRQAEKRATTDELTRVRNKNAYTKLEEELQRSIDNGTAEPLAIAVCDVNNLKGVNDDHGHKAGDALLQAACKLICVVYAHSPVFRVGGDEFAVVMRGEDYQNRQALLEKMRATACENLKNGGAVVAIGMSEYKDDDYISDVFERADQEMYENKRALKQR